MQGVICIIEVRGRAILTSVDDLIDWMIGIRARLGSGHCHYGVRGPLLAYGNDVPGGKGD
jgi:hypothetical protein